MKNLAFLSILMLQLAAQADLVSVFKSLESSRKGAFGYNTLQGAQSRINVNVSGNPPANFQFQAAYRNDIGKDLANHYDFFVGNLFTTNYYELMGEYVYGDSLSSHPLNHSGLVSQGPKAITKAASMVRHWVLEKYYMGRYPQTSLAKGFTVRGISGSEFEQEYADYFFDFYLSSKTSEFQHLPLFLLAKDSPIGSSNQLDRARTLIATVFDQYSKQYNANDQVMTRLYSIRNHIHNQLSPDVVSEIDQFLVDFTASRRTNYNDLVEIRKILATFFSFGPDKLISLAQKMGASEIKILAQRLSVSHPAMTDILALSNAVANLRSDLSTSKVAFEQKSIALQIIFNSSLLLNRLLIANSSPVTPAAVEVILNVAYFEGFLVKDNWAYFKQEVSSKTDAASALKILPEMIDVASDTLVQAFSPALDQWKTIEPKMLNFIDDTLKSSAINTASVIAQRNGRN